jgi:type I restriction enzyme M protein
MRDMAKNWKEKIFKKIKELDSERNILTVFDETNRKIDFSDCIKQHQKQNFEDEAYIRAYFVLRLIKELEYPCEAIELEKKYSIGHPSRKEARLDILVKDKKRNSFMLLECKTPETFLKEKEDAIENQLFAIAKQEIKDKIKPRYLVYSTINIENGEVVDNAIIIDFEQFPTYDEWIDAGEPALDEIPVDYGIAKKYTFTNIERPDLLKGVKPLRRDYTLADFEKLRVDLHNKLWAGGEADYNDIFYHLIKIMLVKIYDELFTPEGAIYDFQLFYKNGKPEKPGELAKRLEDKYKIALKELLNYDDEKIKEIPLIERDKFTYEKLFYAAEKLQEISLTENIHSKDEDVLGLFFESILQNEFKQSKGQYFTHKNIVRFLIYALEIDKLAINRLNQTYPHFPYIIDPGAGSGTFLIEAMKVITKEVLKNENKLKITRASKEKVKDLKDPNRKHRWAEDYTYGIEPNARLGLATKLNMILHGDGNMNIFIEDGLMPFKIKGEAFYTRKWKGKDVGLLAEGKETSIYSKTINERFDVIISNPPFSMKIEAMRSYRYIKDTFVFYDKKNSENLFVERWFQLLAPKGRLGVVLPESVFDTKENLYIRNFLFKYFEIKAIISLPKDAFEPYTSTKVSLLIAVRKTNEEVKNWEDKWREFSNQYNKLRRSTIIDFFIENEKILNSFRTLLGKYEFEIDYSKVLVHDLLNDTLKNQLEAKIEQKDKNNFNAIVKRINSFKDKNKLDHIENEENKNILRKFLKQFYPEERQFNSFKELFEYIYDDILEVAVLDYPQIKGQNNYCNSWWVFGEVAKHFNYSIFYAEIENIGYKRTKRPPERDKDIFLKNDNGEIVAFKNDLFKVKAEKIKRTYWVKKGKKEISREREEIIKSDIIIDTENPETVLDYLRKANIWSDII